MTLISRIDKSIDNALRTQQRKTYARTLASDSKVDFLGRINKSENTVTLSDGRELQAILSGNPSPIDTTLKITGKKGLMIEEKSKQTNDDMFGRGLLILRTMTVDGDNQYQYFVKDIKKDTLFPIDTYAVSGAFFQPGENKIASVVFSPNGKHILVGSITIGDDDEFILKWGVMKKFKLVTSGPSISFTLEQGTFSVTSGIVPQAANPASIAAPVAFSHSYSSSKTFDPGFTLPYCVSRSETVSIVYNFEPETDPDILSFFSTPSPTFETSGTGKGIYVFSNESSGAGDPIVDFIGSYNSRAPSNTFYRLANITEHFDIDVTMLTGSGSGSCNRIIDNVETFTYGLVNHPYLSTSFEVSQDVCLGFVGDSPITQSRTVTSDVDTSASSTPSGAAGSIVCSFVEADTGTCSIPTCGLNVVLPSPAACPGGFMGNFFSVDATNFTSVIFSVKDLQDLPVVESVITKNIVVTTDTLSDTVSGSTSFGGGSCSFTDIRSIHSVTTGAGPTNELTPRKGFRPVLGAETAATYKLEPSTNTLYATPYLTVNPTPLATIPQAFSDTHVFMTGDDPALAGEQAKATDSELFQGFKSLGSPDVEIDKFKYSIPDVALKLQTHKNGQENVTYLTVDWILR